MFITVFIIATMSFVLLVPFLMVLVLAATFAQRTRPRVVPATVPATSPASALTERRARAAA